MSDIEYSAITSDVIKSFDCKTDANKNIFKFNFTSDPVILSPRFNTTRIKRPADAHHTRLHMHALPQEHLSGLNCFQRLSTDDTKNNVQLIVDINWTLEKI